MVFFLLSRLALGGGKWATTTTAVESCLQARESASVPIPTASKLWKRRTAQLSINPGTELLECLGERRKSRVVCSRSVN